MASRIQDALTSQGNHAVGNLNSLKVKTVSRGATVVGAPIDNFTLGELGFDDQGNRTVKQLSAVDKKAVLVAAPETRYLGEAMADFYNGVGENVRCVILEEGYTRFDTSAFSGTPANGKVAHFDPTTKKFIISDTVPVSGDYTTAVATFVVVDHEDNIEYTTGQELVRFEVLTA